LDCDSTGSWTDESGNGTFSFLRAPAGRFAGFGPVNLLRAGNGILDEVDALLQRNRRIPTGVANVAAQSDVRQKRFVSVYFVDGSKKYLDTMHSILLPYLQRLLQKYAYTYIYREMCIYISIFIFLNL